MIVYCKDNGIQLGKYTDLWGTNNYRAKEVIFARRVGDTNSPEVQNFPIGMENAESGNCPTQTLVDAYEMQNGGQPSADNPYEGRDPRFKMTIACNGDTKASHRTRTRWKRMWEAVTELRCPMPLLRAIT